MYHYNVFAQWVIEMARERREAKAAKLAELPVGQNPEPTYPKPPPPSAPPKPVPPMSQYVGDGWRGGSAADAYGVRVRPAPLPTREQWHDMFRRRGYVTNGQASDYADDVLQTLAGLPLSPLEGEEDE
jgi:hypothetical protein